MFAYSSKWLILISYEISITARRPGTNHRLKKMVKTPDLKKCLFGCISYKLMAKIKKSAWKYRIDSSIIPKKGILKHFLD